MRLRSESTPLGPADSGPPSCHVPMKDAAPLSGSKRPRSGRPLAAADGSDAHAGGAKLAEKLLLRSSAVSCEAAVRTSRLWRCWPASSNCGPPQREAVKREAVKRASAAEVVSGVAAAWNTCMYRSDWQLVRQHGATGSKVESWNRD